jgi:signal transduction histidine kinase
MNSGKMLGALPDPDIAWDFMRYGFVKRCFTLLAFGVALCLLTNLGYELRDESESLSLIWPMSGLLFMVLWLSPGRNWGWLIGTQLIVQVGMYYLNAERVNWTWGPLFALGNSVDGVVAAMLARRFITAPTTISISQLLRFFASVALGGAVGALVGGYASIHTSTVPDFIRQWQLWWAGTWLGSLFLAPVIICWAVRWLAPQKTSPAPAPLDLILTGSALLLASYWTFSAPPGGVFSIFQSPVTVMALVILVAFRMPPRWAATLTALCVLMVAYFTSRHLGPFSIDPNSFTRVGSVQLYMAALIVIDSMLVTVLVQIRTTLGLLRQSEERYRYFVEKSFEAVWQVELASPMALTLEPAAQLDWFRQHAGVAECNNAYLRLNRLHGLPQAGARIWSADSPWSKVYFDNVARAASSGYSIDGLQFTIGEGYTLKTYLTEFTGVIVDNHLVRVWGVARDISVLVELNKRLQQKQERVQMYARQLAGAEERARRATAVDLHDGIGQQLVGLAMSLDAAATRSLPEVRLLLGEATQTLRDIHSVTQRVIADLSPPGLYELGLGPALQWLSVYQRGHDNLTVDLQIQVDEADIDLELRILAFKLIRELLRNVIKHSGQKSARVVVGMAAEELHIDVVDQGVGFEWQLSLFETRDEGFGLWSIAERVREAGGTLNVETAPGRGCKVSLSLPLDRRSRRDGPIAALDLRNGGHAERDSAANI